MDGDQLVSDRLCFLLDFHLQFYHQDLQIGPGGSPTSIGIPSHSVPDGPVTTSGVGKVSIAESRAVFIASPSREDCEVVTPKGPDSL